MERFTARLEVAAKDPSASLALSTELPNLRELGSCIKCCDLAHLELQSQASRIVQVPFSRARV